MTLEELEFADRLIREASFTGTKLAEVFEAYQRPREELERIEHLLADDQFYVLLDIKRAEQHLLFAYDRLSLQTMYLREELEGQIRQLNVLLQKIQREEHLRRDRDALLSPA